MGVTGWVVVVVVLATGLLVARRWLPDRDTVADTAYDAFRALVPAPRPTVRAVTRRLARVCRRQRVVLPFGQRAVLPRAFLVVVSPAEFEVVEALLDTVQDAVSASLVRTAREKQWLHAGVPRVLIQASETVAEGRPQVVSTTLPAPGPTRDPLPRESTVSLQGGAGPSGSRPLAAEASSRAATHATSAEPAYAEPTYAEPTCAELPPSRRYRLRSDSGEPDILVGDQPVVAGRGADCGVVLLYPSASRRHLQLTATTAGCRLEDLGSRHGTRVNGSPVRQPILLRPRDTVQLGSMGPCWTVDPSYGVVDQPASGPVRPTLREVR